MTTLKIKRGPSGNLTGITPAEGELVFVTNTKELRVGDGSTVGAANLSVNKASVADTANAVAGANVSGTVSSANNSSYLGGVAAAGYAQLSGATFTGNVSGTNISVTGNANAVSFTGNLTGNVTGNLSGNATFAGTVTGGTQANIATLGNVNLQLASSSTSGTATRYLLMQTVNGGTAKLESAVGITANAANSSITATTFVGALSGTATFADTANAVAGANVSGTVANANNSSYLGGVAAAGYAQLSGAAFTGNVSGTNISVTGNANATTFTGNVTTPGNGIVKSTSGNITIEANQIIQGLRVNGETDVTALPGVSQTGWYFNNQWNLQTTSPGLWTNAGSTTDSLDVYFIVPTSATSGSNIVAIDTLGLESLQNGPLTWDSANAALLVGQGISVYDLDVISNIPSSTIFAAGATITAVDVAGGNITISSNALKSSTNFAINAGTLVSDATHGFYQLIGDTAVTGSIDFWDPPILTTATGQLTGWGGPFTGNTTAGANLTYTPSKTWSTYPELRDAATPGGLRAIDVNNVPGSVMSFTRYNNPIVIGADSTGNAAGYPTTTGRADQALTFQGVTMINTNLDTRKNGDISVGNNDGTVPKMALNFITYEVPDGNANATVQRWNREKQGSLVSTTEAYGNILTDNANLYVRSNSSLGSIRWGALAGTAGPSTANPNPTAPQAGIYTRAEADFSAATSTPTGLYLQYTPTGQGAGQPRTFVRAASDLTTVNGTAVSLKPLANKAPITVQSGSSLSETNRRNYLRELNATQDQTFLTATYYSGGNANAQGSGTTVQVRSDARVGNVALQIGRNAISTMASAWVASRWTTLGQYISNGGNYYEATGTNTTGTANYFKLGTTGPSHTSGNVLNGNTYLTYVGSTAAEGAGSYELIIKTAETDLTLYDKTNSANIATFNNSRAAFAVPVQFPAYTATAANAITGAVGQQICISDSAQGSNPNGMMAFWDTTHSRWSYIHDNSAV